MKAFHLLGAAPLYTNSFVLISDAGHAVVIDPAAEVQEYDKIFKENNATLTTILCTHGHYDHVGSAGVLSREWKARIYCEPADCRGSQLFPLKSADSGYQEGEKLTVDELTFTVWHTPGHTEGGVVLLCGVDYESYENSAQYLSYLLTPATVCLAVPLLSADGTFEEESGSRWLRHPRRCTGKPCKRPASGIFVQT